MPGRCACQCCHGKCVLNVIGIINVVVAAALFITAGVFGARAVADPRGDKVGRYDAEVDKWVNGGADAHKKLWDGLDIPVLGTDVAIKYIVGTDVGTEASLTPLVVDTESKDAYGTLPDGDPDYARYTTGRVLVSTNENVHRTDQGMVQNVVGLTVGGQTLQVRTYYCNLHQRSEGEDKNNDQKRIYHWAEKGFLVAVDLTEASTEKWLGVKPLDDSVCPTSYVKFKMPESESYSAAEQDCIVGGNRPERNLDLTITIRSPNDPYVHAGAIGGCDLKFGPTAEEYAGVAMATGLGGLAPFIIGVVCFLCARRMPTPSPSAQPQVPMGVAMQPMHIPGQPYPQQPYPGQQMQYGMPAQGQPVQYGAPPQQPPPYPQQQYGQAPYPTAQPALGANPVQYYGQQPMR